MNTTKTFSEQSDEFHRRYIAQRKDSATWKLPIARSDLKLNEEYLEKLLNWSHQNEDIQKLIKSTKRKINYYKKRIREFEEEVDN